MLLLVVLLPLFGDHEERHGHIPKNFQPLHLSKAQYRELKEILKEHRKRLRELHQEEERLEEMLRELFQEREFDKEKFLTKKRQLKLNMATIETDFFVKLHRLFTSKQRRLFSRYIEEWEIE